MRVVIQRVSSASVTINNIEYSSIEKGLLILLGIEDTDTDVDIDWLCGKISRLRIFDDEGGVMNNSIMDIKGSVLVVSQFTLHASIKKGNRPSYIKASKPDFAIPMYEQFIKKQKFGRIRIFRFQEENLNARALKNLITFRNAKLKQVSLEL